MKFLRFAIALVAFGPLCGVARADGLTPQETTKLMRGETVVRREDVSREGRRYVGGIAYSVLNADPRAVAKVLDDVDAWRRVLPKTRSVRHVGAVGADRLVELTQGNALIQATYTVRVHEDHGGIRFWMDPQRPHDVEDVWGFARAEPLPDGKALLTYGVLVDIGPGIMRDLFEERVRDLAMTVPDRVRGLLAEHSAAASPSW